jgi:hypothetical protein
MGRIRGSAAGGQLTETDEIKRAGKTVPNEGRKRNNGNSDFKRSSR